MDDNLLNIVAPVVGCLFIVYLLVIAIVITCYILQFVLLCADAVYEKITGRSTTVLMKLGDHLDPFTWGDNGGVLGKIINFFRIFDLFS